MTYKHAFCRGSTEHVASMSPDGDLHGNFAERFHNRHALLPILH
jgi:hypothetical protein